MSNFAKALALFGAGSLLGTITQVIKGKLGAIFLDAEGIGILNQLTNVWSFLYTISGLGFYNGIVQRISIAHREDDFETLRHQFLSSLIFLTVFSLISTTIAVTFSAWISNLIFGDNGQKSWLVSLILWSIPAAVIAQIYVGLFSGCKLVRQVVRAQITTDLTGTVVFILLIIYKDLPGAVVAFGIANIIKLAIQIYMVNKHFSTHHLYSPLITFDFSEIKLNVGYGASGLLLVSIGILTTTTVSKWIIEYVGLQANGLFSVSWKVCSLYFGALYASASSYYFPMLAASQNSKELSNQVFEAITLYMYVMTPLAIGLIIGGELLMNILFSRDFTAAASLLSWFLPADILRIFSETIGLSFLAKKKLKIYSFTYFVWASVFLALSWYMIKSYGLIGVGYAYFLSHLINAIVLSFCVKLSFGFSVSYEPFRGTVLALLAAGISMYVVSLKYDWWLQYAIGILIVMIWFALNWNKQDFQMLIKSGLNRVRVSLS